MYNDRIIETSGNVVKVVFSPNPTPLAQTKPKKKPRAKKKQPRLEDRMFDLIIKIPMWSLVIYIYYLVFLFASHMIGIVVD